MAMLIAKYGEPGEKVPTTYKQAWEAVHRHGEGLFGV
jgi:phospholipase C